jgi:maltose O-acetyltransferase
MSTVIALAPFNPAEPQNRAARQHAKKLCMQLNALRVDQTKARAPIYKELFGKVSSAFIEPDFFCDYGYNIFIGEIFLQTTIV